MANIETVLRPYMRTTKKILPKNYKHVNTGKKYLRLYEACM